MVRSATSWRRSAGEIEWDLDIALPDMKAALRGTERADELKSASHVARHAPTNLHPGGPRWFERAPIISRLVTLYDRMRDYPMRKVR